MKTAKALLGLLTLILGLAVQVQAQSFLTNGLVVYYPFNGNANDASGNGNNGTVNGATLAAGRFGDANSAYYFNGVSSEILVPETLFGPTAEAVTVSLWITFDSGPYTDLQAVFVKSCVNGEMSLFVEKGLIYFGPKLADSPPVWVNTPVRSNSVMHVVGVYQKGQTISLYINGVLVDNTPVPNRDLYVEPFPLISALGAYHYIPGPYVWFRGTLEDFRVYTRALSASEVQQLYHFESSTCPVPFIASQPRSQVGYWGKGVTFSAAAVANTPLSYQWLKDGVPVEGASESWLILTNLQATNAGNYSVVVTNDCGAATSSNAYLTVNPAGVSLALYSGITIDGVVGLTYGIQYSTDLSNTNGWLGMANVTLSVPIELWFDVLPANQPRRYYRVVPGPISIP